MPRGRGILLCVKNDLFPREFHLLMHRLLAAPITEFFEFDLALDLLAVFVDVIIAPFADGAAEGD